MKYLSYGFGVLAVGAAMNVASSAQAAEPASTPTTIDHGTQIHAPQEVAEQFSEQEAQRKPPLRPGQRLAPSNARPFTAQGRLHEVADGYIRLEVALTPERTEVLLRLGAREVDGSEKIRNHTIFRGMYYQDFRLAPPAGERCSGCAAERIEGPDVQRLLRKVGDIVTLKLARDRNGRPWVTDLTL
ncbi:MAG: hypothetical protein AAFN74_04990 [Myxococcota bacterium]